MKKSLMTAVLAGGLLLGSAVPGYAAPADHCPEEISAREAFRCVCIIAIPILEDVTGRDWQCAAS